MRVLLSVAALVVVVGGVSLSVEDQEFNVWKTEFGKSYSSGEEESQRKITWIKNRKLILEHNILADQGLKSYRLDMNQFGDMENQEYSQMFSSCLRSFNSTKTRRSSTLLQQSSSLLQQRGGAVLPSSVNWTAAGFVTKVKHQLNCGSCWAFSAAGALEAQMYRKTRRLVSLSKQQMLDCSWFYGNFGCEGGSMENAFSYVKNNRGLDSEASYPYQAKEGMCRFNPLNTSATCRGFESLPVGDEDVLQEAVASIGPVSAAIDTKRHTFQFYKSGVYDDPYYSSTELDHGVLVVGYGTNYQGLDYWVIKNSWGVQWGEDGYIRMSRNKRNQCGIATRTSFPLV